MKTIYLVMAETAYEGGVAVRAFEVNGEAEGFAQKCKVHERKRPQTPGLDAPDLDWDNYRKRYARWEKTHPAKPHTGFDSYSVSPLKFQGKEST